MNNILPHPDRKFFISWLVCFIVMYGLSYTWHGIVLNDFIKISYPKDVFLLISGLIYFVIALLITVLTYMFKKIKDSFKYGNFGENVKELEIILANGRVIKCSKQKNKDIFQSTLGGLGLLGIVTKVKLQLKRNRKKYITTHHTCNNYRELIKEIYKQKENYDYIYGWIDTYAKNNFLGRGIIFKSKSIDSELANIDRNFLSTVKNKIQQIIFSLSIKNNLMKYLNYIYFKRFQLKENKFGAGSS